MSDFHCIEFPGECMDLAKEDSSEAWKGLCAKVREALETQGCFFLKPTDYFTPNDFDKMLRAMKEFFDLPHEAKAKCDEIHTKSFSARASPLAENISVSNASQPEVAQAFTSKLWQHGNPSFCETLNVTSSKMETLCLMVMKMVLKSFFIEKYHGWFEENYYSNFRMVQHKSPSTTDLESTNVKPHNDRGWLTIMWDNQVQALQVLSKEGNWISVDIPNGTFIVFIGDQFEAWSNGRIRAIRHKVVMKSSCTIRYSCVLFLYPKDETIIDVPQELVDEEHPLMYRSFKHSDYLKFLIKSREAEALRTFAGF